MFLKMMPVTQSDYNVRTKLAWLSIHVCLQKKIIILLTTDTWTADNLFTEIIKARWNVRTSSSLITRKYLKHMQNIELTLSSLSATQNCNVLSALPSHSWVCSSHFSLHSQQHLPFLSSSTGPTDWVQLWPQVRLVGMSWNRWQLAHSSLDLSSQGLSLQLLCSQNLAASAKQKTLRGYPMHVGDAWCAHPEIAVCLGHEGAWTGLPGGNTTKEALRRSLR